MASFEVIIAAGEQAERLDRVLTARIDESRSQIQRWIELERITAGGAPVSARSKYPVGTVVVVDPPEPESCEVEAEAMELEILFEDKDLIILNKPAGLVVHPGAGCRHGTLVSGLLHHCRGELSGIGGVERPGIVHRLDKETSGVIAVAKNDYTHQKLSEAFQNRQVTKCYRAYVHRGPVSEKGSWRFPLGRHPVHRKKQAVRTSGGREARTDFQVLQRWDKFSVLDLNLFTGRTHQIRVHASHAGFPLVGDVTYGGKKIETAGVDRHLLHAMTLGIIHPRTGESLAITAPLPEDFIHFEAWLNQRH
jgi:23S rRNA pseudouridine1911/1915/1917 synthase